MVNLLDDNNGNDKFPGLLSVIYNLFTQYSLLFEKAYFLRRLHINILNINAELEPVQVDLTGVQLSLAERQSELPHTARSAVSGVIPDPKIQVA